MEAIPTIVRVMRPFPYFVDLGDSLESARALMREHAIGHLPVKDANRLVGILGEADLRAFERSREPLSSRTVADAYVPDPFVVPIGARLDAVVAEMALRGVDSALVVKDDHLAGILTTTDVCHILAQLLITGDIPAYDQAWRQPPPDDVPA